MTTATAETTTYADAVELAHTVQANAAAFMSQTTDARQHGAGLWTLAVTRGAQADRAPVENHQDETEAAVAELLAALARARAFNTRPEVGPLCESIEQAHGESIAALIVLTDPESAPAAIAWAYRIVALALAEIGITSAVAALMVEIWAGLTAGDEPWDGGWGDDEN